VATTALASTRADGVTRAAAAMSSCWGRAVDSVRGGGQVPYAHPQNWLRCKNTLYMYDMDVGCSLKGFMASAMA
jgi:hypothetical protein